MPMDGSSAAAKTTMPMPPSQWVKERQNSTDRACPSMSVRIVEPVVEKPEQISKKASTGFGIAPVSTIGTAPTTEAVSQIRVTAR